MITAITEEDENNLDEGLPISIVRDNKTYNINPTNVYCYGEIDFKKGSEDSEVISNFTWLDHRILRGIVIPSHYDYETNEIMASDDNIIKYYDTVRPEKVTRWLHGLLNKPNRTLIFKHTW